METLLFLGVLFFPIIMISFLVTFGIIPKWIKRAHIEGLTAKDVHKKDKRQVAEGGGILVLTGFVVGVLLYVAIKTFLFKDQRNLIEIFGLLGVLLFASIIGVVDDLLGWKKGLSKRTRIILLIFAAIPLVVLNAGQSNVLGIELGLIFPLLIVPLAIAGASATYNFLAGYNGLEASQGIIILAGLTIVNFINGNPWLSVLSSCMIASLLGFYLFNKYPAKIFPGDILTYSIGAMIACLAILGNIEKIALFFFIPYILEMILKARGKLKKESFGKLNKDGSLDPLYDKVYGLEHIAIRLLKKIKPNKKAYEWEVPFVINIFQIIVICIGFIIFF